MHKLAVSIVIAAALATVALGATIPALLVRGAAHDAMEIAP